MDYSPAFNIHQSLYGAFSDAADKYPDNRALLYMGVPFRYRDVKQKIDALAANLTAFGIRRGDIVSVCLPNIPDAVFWFYAVAKVGARAHLVHPLTTPEQMRGYLSSLDSRLLVVLHTAAEGFTALAAEKGIRVVYCNPSDFLPLPMRLVYNAQNKSPKPSDLLIPAKPLYKKLPALPSGKSPSENKPGLSLPTDGEETAVLLHSGGTSGAPKAIALSARAVNSLSAKGLYVLGVPDVTHKTMLSVLPMFHGFGMCMGIHAMLCHGGCNAIMPKFNAKKAVGLLYKNQLNFIIGVPILYEALLRQKKFCGPVLQNVDVAFVGGDFVSHKLLKTVDERFAFGGSKARLFEGYGLTETVTVCAVNTHAANKSGSVGRAVPGLTIEAYDEKGALLPRGESGELYVSGDTLMTEYVGNGAATKETFFTGKDGALWVKTGDCGYVDDDGFVFFRQRMKRIVKVSGVSVYPFEVEQLVSSYEGVTAVCALDVPDARHGSMLRLYVAAPETDGENRAALKERILGDIKNKISVYAVPREVVFRKFLPTTSVGKIDAESLRKEDNLAAN